MGDGPLPHRWNLKAKSWEDVANPKLFQEYAQDQDLDSPYGSARDPLSAQDVNTHRDPFAKRDPNEPFPATRDPFAKRDPNEPFPATKDPFAKRDPNEPFPATKGRPLLDICWEADNWNSPWDGIW